MGWECHWVWRNVCFSYRHFTCPVTPCPPRARLIFGKAATRTGPLCGGFALGRCCPVLVAALPLWVIRGSAFIPRMFHVRIFNHGFHEFLLLLSVPIHVIRGSILTLPVRLFSTAAWLP